METFALLSEQSCLWCDTSSSRQRFSLKGINWFGCETGNYCVHGLWQRPLETFLHFLVREKFNAIRVPVSAELALNLDGILPNGINFELNPQLQDVQPLPGAAATGTCAYERPWQWALQAEKLDLPRLAARCERFLAMHWEHVRNYTELGSALSPAARDRIATGLFLALQNLRADFVSYKQHLVCRHGHYMSAGAGKEAPPVKYPSQEEFMSWRAPHGGPP